MGKIKVLYVKNNKDIDLISVKTEEDMAHVTKNVQSKFSTKHIFGMKIFSTMPIFARWLSGHRKRFPCLIQREGKDQPCELQEATEILAPLTNEESARIVKRTMALGLQEFKPISIKMFIILVIMLIIIVIQGMVIMGALKLF